MAVDARQDIVRRWDQRYLKGASLREPSPLLVESAHLLPTVGRALDVAMGAGRHALFLAARGLEVIGVDISPVAVEICRREAARLGLPITAICADVTTYPIPQEAFDVVLDFYFLERELCPRLEEALRPGGLLFFETFTTAQLALGWGPRNPHYLLRPGELPSLFPHLEPLLYREGLIHHGPRPTAIASLIARRPS